MRFDPVPSLVRVLYSALLLILAWQAWLFLLWLSHQPADEPLHPSTLRGIVNLLPFYIVIVGTAASLVRREHWRTWRWVPLLAVLANIVPFVGLWSSEIPTYSGGWMWAVVLVAAMLALVATLATARDGRGGRARSPKPGRSVPPVG
jgi:hypothetical protein